MALVESIVTGSAIVALCAFAYNQVNAVFIRSEKYKKALEISHLAMKMLEELNGSTEHKITVMTVDNIEELKDAFRPDGEQTENEQQETNC